MDKVINEWWENAKVLKKSKRERGEEVKGDFCQAADQTSMRRSKLLLQIFDVIHFKWEHSAECFHKDRSNSHIWWI